MVIAFEFISMTNANVTVVNFVTTSNLALSTSFTCDDGYADSMISEYFLHIIWSKITDMRGETGF